MRTRRARAACLLAALAVLAAALAYQVPASSPPVASSTTAASSAGTPPAGSTRGGVRRPPRPLPAVLGLADGAVPDGTTVFDDTVPGVANLRPALLGALRRAAVDAAADGVEVIVDSGWRSPAYQARLLREAVRKYGSEAEAARWVASPDTSAHVSGAAVDVGRAGAAWLSAHGAWYGLCQSYRNEPWHYELRPDAVARGCPPAYADPTHDPRTRR